MTSPTGLVTDKIELGIVYYLTGVLAMAVLDACAKWLTTDYAVPQIVFLQSFIAFTITFFITRQNGVSIVKTNHPYLQIVRGIITMGTVSFFFFGVRYFRLADIVALVSTAPLFMTVLSIAILRENVGFYSKCAVFVGFIGALIIIRPGWGAFQWAAVLPLLCALCYASATILSRKLAATDNPWTTLAYTNMVMVVLSGGIAPFYWLSMTPIDVVVILIMGTAGTISVFLRVKACRYAPVNILAPFDYTGLIWAAVFGYVIWLEFPDLLVWFGAGAIALSGIYVLRRGQNDG